MKDGGHVKRDWGRIWGEYFRSSACEAITKKCGGPCQIPSVFNENA